MIKIQNYTAKEITDQEILWFDVAVYDVQWMQIAECKAEVVDHTASILLTVLTRLSDRIEQITTLRSQLTASSPLSAMAGKT